MSVMLVSGDDGFSRRRFVSKVESEAQKRGWLVEKYSGKDREGLSSLLMNSGFFFRKAFTLAIIETTGEVQTDLLIEHAFSETRINPQVEVLVHCQSKPKPKSSFGNLAKKLPKTGHKVFLSPTFWKADEAAVEFCVEEAKSLNHCIDSRLASALVDRVGVDYGFLSFEIKKAAALAAARQESSITSDILRSTMSVISEASIFLPLTSALGEKNLTKTLRVLNRIEITHRGDPTMRVIGSLYKTLTLWVQAKDLSDRRIPPHQAAEILGQNPWRHKNVLLPIIRVWSREDLYDLIQHFAATQRVVLAGSINPWLYLVSGVIQILSSDE